MALLAEELVEEWLNRQGYFTIRGVKIGVQEMDLLAIRPQEGRLECRHIEVQVSINPVSYISKLTKEDQKSTGKTATTTAPRSPDVYERAVDAWVDKKFGHGRKQALLKDLAPGPWTRELVVHSVAHPEELDHLRKRGVTVHSLDRILRELAQPSVPIARAAGGDFVELLWLGKLAAPDEPSPITLVEEIVADDEPDIDLRDRFRGCLLAGAVGDALGSSVEFMSRSEILARFGSGGIRDFAPAYGRLGAITDDTQMTLFTAEGILRTEVRLSERGIANPFGTIRYAYERWLATQGERPPDGYALAPEGLGWLYGVRALHSRRAPGHTCLSALRQRPNDGGCAARNDSKGCGGVMRVAPVGLIANNPFEYGSGVAAITHGHPLGYESAGAMAALIGKALTEKTLAQAVAATLDEIADHREIVGWMRRAADLASSDVPADRAIESLGEGWVAEEALAIGIFCALRAENMKEALILAVNHSGDSDSTGSIAGQLLGASLGEEAIPRHWLETLELRETIERLADDLYSWFHNQGVHNRDEWWQLYPGA
ncbi:hypothetical protein BH11ARM2_BH11ARM2_09770 [soil metagenome]